jgi:CubicO group peptidase (beta-lactamase class C family)
MEGMTELLEKIRTVVETERERFGVPGCAVAVVRDGEVLLAEGFGLRDAEAGLPVTGRTLFPIGSSTKTFTAALCASLVDAGLLDFDAPVRMYLPGFELHDPVATQLLSVRDCLSHRSGLPRHDIVWYAGDGILSRDDIVSALKHLPPTKPFRQVWQYNNLLYITAGHLAGRLDGGTYEEAVTNRILAPLKMARTNFEVEVTQADEDFSHPYVRPSGAEQPSKVPYASLNLAGPAGNINSCVEEMARWVLTLLGRGVDGNPPLLSDAVLSQLRTPTMPRPESPLPGPARQVAYGLGLTVEEYRGKRAVHHGGNIDGFSSQVWMVPEDGVGVVVLTNLNVTSLRDALPYLILDVLDGVEGAEHGVAYHQAMTALWDGMEQAKQAGMARSKGLPAVRPLADYVGTYRHEGYREVVVGVQGDTLSATYLGLPPLAATHKHLEVFDFVTEVSGETMPFAGQFTHDLEGDVDALLLKIEPTLPPLRFDRQPSTAHLTTELLDSLVGTYTHGPLNAVVSRRGDKGLVLALAGQPPAELVPVHDRVFALSGTQLEFTDEALLTPYGEFVRS